MSEAPDPTGADPLGGPISRPSGDGLPPKTGGLTPPDGRDSVDPGMQGDGDIGQDTGGPNPGGMIGEG